MLVLSSLATATLFTACGSRTGLLVPDDEGPADAAVDRVMRDATREPDAALFDSPPDAPFDSPLDAEFPDVPVIDLCPDAGSTLIYLLSQDNTLWSFYPPTLDLRSIGIIDCPDSTDTPFSMAVDRRGIAYSVFEDGLLFRVDTATAACLPTPFVADQQGFDTFGMGFVANTGDAGETLYVDEANPNPGANGLKPNSQGLATIDVTSYALDFVASFSPAIPGAELTGTSDGRLFAFFTNASGTGSHIVQVDKATGAILVDYPLQVGNPENGYAFGFWGGDFWIFTSSPGTTQVTEFDPTTKTETPATTFATEIVGAGVSTCAPQ